MPSKAPTVRKISVKTTGTFALNEPIIVPQRIVVMFNKRSKSIKLCVKRGNKNFVVAEFSVQGRGFQRRTKDFDPIGVYTKWGYQCLLDRTDDIALTLQEEADVIAKAIAVAQKRELGRRAYV